MRGQFTPRRIAFVDLNFSWPPNGGADTDLIHVVEGLQRAGHTVKIVAVHEAGSTDRGNIDPARVPVPVQVLEFTRATLTPPRLSAAFREAVDAWTPDLVFVMHGYALKPHLLLALAHHRTVSRYYAHELACLRDPLRFKDGAPCPNDFLRTPEVCRRCALAHQRDAIRSGTPTTWTVDFLAAEGYDPDYPRIALNGLESAHAVIVSNAQLRDHAAQYHPRVRVLPGGVNVAAITPTPKPDTAKKVLLMTGRVDDPLKGLPLLREACERLARTRDDFELWATHFDLAESRGWFRALGWLEHAETLGLYAQADVCVVPSVWEEPFGLVAIEAMAAGRPVIAARVGGLQDIVLDGETGLLFPRGDAAALAAAIAQLLDDAPRRVAMGARGRARVEENYDWDVIIRGKYLPLIEELLR